MTPHELENELRQRIHDWLQAIHKRINDMALDLTAITAAVTKVAADADALIASHGTAATQLAQDQAAVDALTPTVTAVSAKIEAALGPPAPPALPAA